MNIWLLQIGEPYPFMKDVRLMRTGLLSQYLAQRNHNVLWWGSNFYHPRKQLLSTSETDEYFSPNLCVRLLEGIPYKSNISVRRYMHHRKVARRFADLAELQSPPDLIVASLPLHDLACEAVKYAKRHHIPIVIDVRDLWPDFFLEYVPTPMKPIARRLLSQDYAKTRYALENADSIISISNDYLAWAFSYAKRSRNTQKDKVFYIGAQALLTSVDVERMAKPDWLSSLGGKIVFGFIGTFGKTYDLDLIVKAAQYFHDQGLDDVHFLIAGDGEEYPEIAKRSNGLTNVTLTGWLGNDEISHFLSSIHVGLVPYMDQAPQSLPNKPFQYLAAGVPIISSLQGELNDILTGHDVGFTYEPENLGSFVDIVKIFTTNTARRIAMGDNALRVFQRFFDADTIYAQMVLYCENLVEKYCQ
jgi:glycosyltransferase involved in cell wall biosynthesis